VWQSWDGNDSEIYLWEGGTTTNISNNSTSDGSPAISGSNVVWQGHDGNDYEIYLWEGGTTTQITSSSRTDMDPAISGSNVVWGGHDGNDYEIYLMRGAPPAANLVPSISFDGLALLGGLVLGIVAWARRGR
jgi:hypothetical protein